MKGRDKDRIRNQFFYAGLGVDLVVSTLVGGVIGYFLDKNFGTTPVFLIIFLVLGFASGFLNIYKIIEKHEKRKDSLR